MMLAAITNPTTAGIMSTRRGEAVRDEPKNQSRAPSMAMRKQTTNRPEASPMITARSKKRLFSQGQAADDARECLTNDLPEGVSEGEFLFFDGRPSVGLPGC